MCSGGSRRYPRQNDFFVVQDQQYGAYQQPMYVAYQQPMYAAYQQPMYQQQQQYRQPVNVMVWWITAIIWTFYILYAKLHFTWKK